MCDKIKLDLLATIEPWFCLSHKRHPSHGKKVQRVGVGLLWQYARCTFLHSYISVTTHFTCT